MAKERSSKRAADSSSDVKRNKKTKLWRARDILAQTPDKSISASTLDVPKFVDARKFEIEQLERAMLKSKMSGTKRAFQTVPRGLRRRTASHNVKRVPSRLRNRAKREMETDNTPSIGEKKLRGHDRVVKDSIDRKLKRESDGKPIQPQDCVGINRLASPPMIKLKFAKRQKDKIWLPTHVWHAKRAHMVNKWGFSIPQRPSEKSYRATHRAHTVSGAVAWDTSYVGTLLLKGEYNGIVNVLRQFLPSQAWSTIVSSGTRCWEGIFSDGEISLGPCLIYWNSLKNENENEKREIFVRLHPAIYESAFKIIAAKSSGVGVECEDLRYAIGSIDLLGSKSLTSLQTILHPDKSLDTTKSWCTLSGVANSTALPNCIIITMNIADPRLFPIDKPLKTSGGNIQDLILQWPSDMAKHSEIVSSSSRQASYDAQLTLKELDRGKGAELRGEENPYKSQYTNYSIPIVLLKRQDGETWTLLLPWGWVLPIWHCLMRVHHIRIGGLNQQHQLAFERGHTFFPVDYPNTPAGQNYNEEKRLASKSEWDRRPAAKRVSYDAVSTKDEVRGEHGDPFSCDWEYLSRISNNSHQLMQVKIKYLHRGSPNDRARIYSLTDDSRSQWKALLTTEEIDLSTYPICPGSENLIGYVTTGTFNLAEGSGFGVGSIISSATDRDNLCLVRNIGTNVARLARWTIIC
jgi:ribonuclease P/MRP protein subunit POP1